MTMLEQLADAARNQRVEDDLAAGRPVTYETRQILPADRRAVLAVLRAMREPSDEMVLAYARHHYDDNWGDETAAAARKFTDAEAAWQHMLDALIGDGHG